MELICKECGEHVGKVVNIRKKGKTVYVCTFCRAVHYHEAKKDLPVEVEEDTKAITLNLSETDMLTIEDMFFCENDIGEYMRMKPRILEIWKRICKSADKSKVISKV